LVVDTYISKRKTRQDFVQDRPSGPACTSKKLVSQAGLRSRSPEPVIFSGAEAGAVFKI